MLVWMLMLAGCSGSSSETPVPRRVEAVQAAPPKADAVQAFCDLHFPAAAAPPFELPELATPAPDPTGHWRWYNVWATWCGPCIAEMPMLTRWDAELDEAGRPVDLVFVSFDAGQAEVTAFASRHPEVRGMPRIASTDVIGPWLDRVGLPRSIAIPLHFWVDPEGHTRCVRSGGLSSGDLAVIKRVLDGE
ncbi:MAG: TlpA family protein disulfide reductase [Alphaproteobacteria bacterium]|nr:TlpA family protein disulfide reductase [Alphaproteobacteria bacterium]